MVASGMAALLSGADADSADWRDLPPYGCGGRPGGGR